MNRLLRKFSEHRVIGALFLVSVLLVGGAMAWAYGAFRIVKGPLILHFDDLFGIDRIGGLGELLGMGVVGLVIVLTNFSIALVLDDRDWFLGKFLAAATVFLGILIFIGFAAIISAN